MKNKKVLFASIALMLGGLVGCGEKTPDTPKVEPCESHKWGEKVVLEEATCAKEGSSQRTCTVCGAKEDAKKISKKAHTYVEDASKGKAATCGEAGEKVEVCSVCKDEKKTPIEKTEHNFGTATDQAAVTGANTPTKIAECSMCKGNKISWAAADYDTALSAGVDASNSKGIRFSGQAYNSATASDTSGTATAEEKVGDHIVYTISVPKAVTGATLSFHIITGSNSAPVFGTVTTDQKAGYEKVNGEWVRTKNRYKIEVNGADAALGDDPYGEVASGTEGTYEFPCTFNLNAGVNTISVQCYGGYRQYMKDFFVSYK